MEESIKSLVQTRKFVRSDITRTLNKLNADPDAIPIHELKSTLLRLKELQGDVKELNGTVMEEMSSAGKSENDLEEEYNACVGYTNKLLQCITLIQSRIETASSQSGSGNNVQQNTLSNFSANKLKLPQLPLPTYSHKEGEDLHKFFLNFENIMGKYNLSDFDRFIFLQEQLSGAPLTLIKSLDINSQSYNTAKELLTRAFASVVNQQFETIKRVTDLKFTTKAPYEYVGKLRQIQEAFKSLNITSDIILQYFFWQSMPEQLQTQFVSITNSNKPNLENIETHIFDAIERFLDTAGKKPTKKSDDVDVCNYAVSMDAYRADKPKQQFCSLCSKGNLKVDSHSTFNCPKYSSTFEKLNQLKSRNGCVKCGNTTHEAGNCRFRFKRTCINCSKFHFSFLCPDNVETRTGDFPKSSSSQNSGASKPNQEKSGKGKSGGEKSGKGKSVNANCIFVNETTLENAGQDSILPTFTFQVNGNTVRAMRDSGCQSSFITQALADELGLPVVKSEFDLGIHGFNSLKRIKTTMVELRIAEGLRPISLVCVPEIRTKLSLPGLNDVVNDFSEKGYILADKLLLKGGDEISNIGIVIGDNEAQIIPQTDVTFGDAALSMFANTPFGIILFGSVERMLHNLPHLPYNENSCVLTSSCSGVIGEPCLEVAKPACVELKFDVLKQDGQVDENILEQALSHVIKEQFDNVLSYDSHIYEEDVAELDKIQIEHVIQNTSRADDGSLRMPLMWDPNVSHRLANNFGLSKAILKSVCKKLQNSPDKMLMYDQVIRDQESLGVIERVDNIEAFVRDHPTCSFLSHMAVFRMDKDTTKCRVVYLSNIADRRQAKDSISHNQAIVSGPCLNKKIATAVSEMRFDSLLLCFDIVKAFLNIKLYPSDQEKLMFLWYKDISKKDYTLVAYKSTRLAFGLRCSPCILGIALYIILIADATEDATELRELKKLIYSLMYVDNGAVTANSSSRLGWAYDQLVQIFSPYQFKLQQFATNDLSLQAAIDGDGEKTPSVVKLFGLAWNRVEDTISTQPLRLDPKANTKRAVLSTIAANYDIFQYNGPILNRARVFIHLLQCDSTLGWDSVLSDDRMRDWWNICRQVNSSPHIEIPRCVGDRNGTFNLVACTDASKMFYGVVVYIQDCSTGKMSFLAAKNKLVNKQLEGKSIPCLEFHAIALGAEMLIQLHDELSGNKSLTPIKISNLVLFSDSMVSLDWLYAACHKLGKLQKVSTFVKNRLKKICELCESKSIEFRHVSGSKNPCDCITRCLSYKQLQQTNYLTGPDLEDYEELTRVAFSVPAVSAERVECSFNIASTSVETQSEVDVSRFSNFVTLFRVQKNVLMFINKLKEKVNTRHAKCLPIYTNDELKTTAWNLLIKNDQQKHFADIVKFFQNKQRVPNLEVPSAITKLNVFMDQKGILRVQSKFDRWSEHKKYQSPVLLSGNSPLCSLIIRDIHRKKGHTGCYNVLNEFRRTFFVEKHFSVIKRVLRQCITCRRVNSRTIDVNQNKYRDFRVSPPNVPFRYIFVDHFGPYRVRQGDSRSKVWVLCITCMWSRAVNLKVCLDLTTSEFLKALQTHIFEYGVPERVLADLGSSIVSGGNVISGFLNDPTVTSVLDEFNIKPMSFIHYAKGNHDLGGIVESCVKLSKRMISGSIGNQVLNISDFLFIICRAVCLINKRPIAFRDALRDEGGHEDLPAPITPEVLLRGHDLLTLNILPYQSVDVDPEWTPESNGTAHIKSSFDILGKNRQKLIEIYQDEFLGDLTRQATDKKQQYKKVFHEKLEVGDVVVMKEPNMKSVHFPMGRVLETTVNELGEVTDVVLMKGNREKVRRHVKSLIPLLKCGNAAMASDTIDAGIEQRNETVRTRRTPVRQTAMQCNKLISDMALQNLV